MSVWLYTPPQYRQWKVMEGALRYSIDTSTTVYRIAGVWHNALSPGMGSPDIRTCDTDAASGLLLYFNTPTVVPDSLHDELAAITPADPSWTAGTLTPQ